MIEEFTCHSLIVSVGIAGFSASIFVNLNIVKITKKETGKKEIGKMYKWRLNTKKIIRIEN